MLRWQQSPPSMASMRNVVPHETSGALALPPAAPVEPAIHRVPAASERERQIQPGAPFFARPQLHADIRSMVTCPRWHPYRETSERTVRSTVFLAHPTVAERPAPSPRRRHLAWPVLAGPAGTRLKSPAAGRVREAARGGGGSPGRPGRRWPSTRGCGRGRAGGRARGRRRSRGARAEP